MIRVFLTIIITINIIKFGDSVKCDGSSRLTTISLYDTTEVCKWLNPNVLVGGMPVGLGNHILYELFRFIPLMRLDVDISYVGFFSREDWDESIYKKKGCFVKHTKYVNIRFNNYHLNIEPVYACSEVTMHDVLYNGYNITHPVYIRDPHIPFIDNDLKFVLKKFLKSISPTNKIQRKVNKIISSIKPFNCVHNRVEKDWHDDRKNQIMGIAEKILPNNSTIYIAGANITSTHSTKSKFFNINDDIEATLIDMFVCSKSETFVGLLQSTFSLIVAYLKDDNNYLIGGENLFWNKELNDSYLTNDLNYNFIKFN